MSVPYRYEVYVLLDENRDIKYVGCTRNPNHRRKEHKSPGSGNSHLTYETWQVYGTDEMEALAAERELIRTLYALGFELQNERFLLSPEDQKEKSRIEQNKRRAKWYRENYASRRPDRRKK